MTKQSGKVLALRDTQ